MEEKIKRSRKSRMKKRPQDWEQLKVEIAQELGLWDTVRQEGWSGLSAADSGRLGGVFAARKKALMEQEMEQLRDYIEEAEADSPEISAAEVVKAEIFPLKEHN